MAPGPSCRRPRRPTPSPWTDSTPSPASARGGVWCGSTRALLSPAARGSRLGCPLAAWAQAPRQRRASVLAPPARRAARRLSRGPSPPRRDGASAPTLRATSLWPAERTHTARARRGRSGRLSGPGHALTGGHGRGGARSTACSSVQGGEEARLPPHGVTLGAAWQPGSAMRPPWRRRPPLRPEALGPAPARLLGRRLPRLYGERTSLLGAVGCPAPAPAPHGRTQRGRPACAEDGRRGQRRFSGAEHPPNTRCRRHLDGGRPASRVWCRHVGAPADGHADGTRCPRRTALGLQHSGKKLAKSALRARLSLDNGGPHKCSAKALVEAMHRKWLSYLLLPRPATPSPLGMAPEHSARLV